VTYFDITYIGDSLFQSIVPGTLVWNMLARIDLHIASQQFSPWSGAAGNNLLIGNYHRLYNAGISGNRTDQMVARFATDVAGHHSDEVHIRGGINDIIAGYTTASITANLASMVASTHALGALPVLHTLLPYNAGTTAQRDQVDAVNAWMHASGEVVEDDYAAIVTDPVARTSTWLQADGIHPTSPEGETILALAADISRYTVHQPAPTKAFFGVDGLIGYWTVNADGTVSDRVTGQVATITATGAVLPSVALWSTIYTGGKGYCANITSATDVRIPMIGVAKEEGTIVAMHNEPAISADVQSVSWQSTTANKVYLRRSGRASAGVGSNVGGILVKALTNQSAGSISKASPTPAPTAIAWKSGEKAYNYLAGTPSAGSTANSTIPDRLPLFAYLGSADGSGNPINTAFAGAAVFNRKLSTAEIATVAALIATGLDPVPVRVLTAGGDIAWQ